MRPDYSDIIERAGEPDWYDEHGTPRYAELTPDALGVYDDEAVFYTIACQACGKTFIVGEGHSLLSGMRISSMLERGNRTPFYGDPPRHLNPDGSRCAGDTMTSDTIDVISYWTRRVGDDWTRLDWERINDRLDAMEGHYGDR